MQVSMLFRLMSWCLVLATSNWHQERNFLAVGKGFSLWHVPAGNNRNSGLQPLGERWVQGAEMC